MFITTNIKNRERIFEDPSYAREAIDTLYRVQQLYPFFLYGFVIMPDHCHFLIQIMENGSVSKIMMQYKSGVSFNIGKGPIWQPRFHLRIPDDVSSALRYIHYNPAKACLAEKPEDYPWSSASGKWDVTELEAR